MYSRKTPYEGEHFKTVLRKVCDRRVNKRPDIPDTTPPKMAELMKKLWSPDPFFRPQAINLDMMLMEMTSRDTEPLETDKGGRRTGDMFYELFPKHIAEALKAGKKVREFVAGCVFVLDQLQIATAHLTRLLYLITKRLSRNSTI